MSTNISQHGTASIKIKAGKSIVGDTGRFQTIDIKVVDKDGAPLLEIICFSVDDIPTNIEIDVPGLGFPSVYLVPAANPPTPDKEEPQPTAIVSKPIAEAFGLTSNPAAVVVEEEEGCQ